MFEIVSRTINGTEPVNLSEAKIYFRSEDSGGVEDGLITSLISGAREEIERLSNRSLIASTVVVYAKDWSGFLPFPPVASITTPADLSYEGKKMPYVELSGAAVEITYETGVFTGFDVKNAILDLADYWYRRGGVRGEIPEAVRKVVASFSLRRGI